MREGWMWQRSLSWAILGVCGVAILLTGCTVYPNTSQGTGTFSYATGALSWVYPVTMQQLWPATLAEVKELQLDILNQNMDGLGGNIEAMRDNNVRVFFKLQPVGLTSTRLSIRIAAQEWQRKEAEHIHERIRARLGL